jgi:hypothetical protein
MFAGFVVAVTASVAAPGQTVAGRVLDERRFPVAGAAVTVRVGRDVDPIAATTNADGRFQFQFPIAERSDDERGYTVLVATADRRTGFALGGIPSLLAPEDGRRQFPYAWNIVEPIRLAPSGRLEVDVCDSDVAVSDAAVELRPWIMRDPLLSTRTDEAGHAVLDPVPVGEFTLYVAKTGRGAALVEARVVQGETTTLRVALRSLRTLKVEVVDVDDGKPIAGAEVKVERSAEGSNPGPFPNLHRLEPCEFVPAQTDAEGRLELRGLEAESVLVLDASADHYAAHWRLDKDEDDDTSSRLGVTTRKVVNADAGAVRLEMKRRPRATMRFEIDRESGSIPPEGSALVVQGFLRAERFRFFEALPVAAAVRGGAVELEVELVPGQEKARPPMFCWARAPDGAIAELQSRSKNGDGTARFADAATLAVTLLGADGARRASEVLMLRQTPVENGSRDAPSFEALTDASGTARFASVRAGRWTVAADGITRDVVLAGGATSIELRPRPPAEIVFAFTLGKERRLPSSLGLFVPDEIASMRREDPARGDVHVFVARPRDGRELQFNLNATGWTPRAQFIAELPEGRPLVVPIGLPERCDGQALAILRGGLPAAMGGWRASIELERKDDASGTFVFDRVCDQLVPVPDRPTVVKLTDLAPGTYRLALRGTSLHGEPAQVVVGTLAELLIDASKWATAEVVWKMPKGEASELPELTPPDELMRPYRWWWWWNWEEMWPVVERWTSPQPFVFDRAAPQTLVVHHPYLVASRQNDAIDLTKPRSAITLHVEAGPLVAFTPRFEAASVAAPPVGAWVTLADADDPSKPVEVRRALRRGEAFVMAPPAAGRRRVLLDPVVAAPVELGPIDFDGGPRDLGEVQFTPGSTLTVHVRATAPFAPPVLTARATRIDGLGYQRASSSADAGSVPFDPRIRGLGPGLFRVALGTGSGKADSTWTAEVRLDGVHDAELTILTD